MKHQVHLGTESGIVSNEAVKQIKLLIADLARTVQMLDAEIATRQEGPRADDLAFMLDQRRHNLVLTVASLEDRLGSIQKVRSRGYRAQANPTPPVPSVSSH
jgi:hypothetical protein